MDSEILIAKKITKSFGRVRVLRGLDLTLDQADVYFLCGSNGAGKTTLARILSTLVRPDTGELIIFGKDAGSNIRRVRAKLGLVTHEPFLYSELTAWENLDFFGRLYSIRNRESRVQEMLKLVGLYHRSHDRVGDFSRGMKQRLSLARAVIHNPEILFMDEPYSGLDMKAQEMLNSLIKRLNSEGKTFFIITHDLQKSKGIANRTGILHEGGIVHESTGDGRDIAEVYRELLGGGG